MKESQEATGSLILYYKFSRQPLHFFSSLLFGLVFALFSSTTNLYPVWARSLGVSIVHEPFAGINLHRTAFGSWLPESVPISERLLSLSSFAYGGRLRMKYMLFLSR